ncbi:site-specific integrase [Methanohalobium evestigatum]|uniref:site-specific integrase n=1 Tax=Methanohalobium evestigatum TaxID=2322 RepID=UPI000677E0B7|nr:site-specific integrase [Methanohalobium evestigatum]
MREGIYECSIEKRIASLKKSNISNRNIIFIQDFSDECFTQGLGEHRVLKYISTLKNIALNIDVDFDEVDKREMKKYISKLERSNKSEWTKHDYKVTLKKFYRWLYEEEPETTKWINATKKRKTQKYPMIC